MSKLKNFQFVTAIALEFNKIKNADKAKCKTFCSSSKAETIINESEMDDVFESIYSAII